ncbi:MAG: head-tail connector protein [Victivallales bacterium]|nr:head-tail connector protein [Victivallales bacterium]
MQADQIIRNLDKLKADRTELNAVLEQCAAFACPEKMGMYLDHADSGGDDRPRYIIIDEISEANSILSRGLFSNLCPPSLQWFSFSSNKKEYKESEAVKKFFSEAGVSLYNLLMKSSFTMEINEAFEDFGWAGTTNLYVERDPKRTFRFVNLHIGEYYVEENHYKQVDTVYREFKLTARQALQRFGNPGDKLPEKVLKDARDPDAAKSGRKYTFIHLVTPNLDRTMDADGKYHPGNSNKAFKSVYVCREEKFTIRESGYDRNPYTVSRFEKKSQSIYGFSPAMRVLRTAKIENKVWASLLKAADKAIDPPVMLDAAAYGRGISPQFFYNPKAVNLYDSTATGGGGKPEFQPVPANLPVGLEMFDRLDQHINRAYYTDMFQMIQQLNQDSGRQRTAYEIMNLVSEKNSMIIPVVGRILDEMFSPLLIKCFFLALEAGELGKLPDELIHADELDLEVSYNSPLALAAKRAELNGFFESLDMLTPLANIKPEVLDYINFDKVTKKVLNNTGAHPDFIRSNAEVKKLREERAAQEQQAQEQLMMTELAKSQDLTRKIEPDSAVSAIGGLLGG